MNTDILREELLKTFADNPHEMLMLRIYMSISMVRVIRELKIQ